MLSAGAVDYFRASSLGYTKPGGRASEARALTFSANMKLWVRSSCVDQLVEETVYSARQYSQSRQYSHSNKKYRASFDFQRLILLVLGYDFSRNLPDHIGSPWINKTGHVLRSGWHATPITSLTTLASGIMCNIHFIEVVAIPVTTLRFLLGLNPSDHKWTLTEFRDCCIHTLACPS